MKRMHVHLEKTGGKTMALLIRARYGTGAKLVPVGSDRASVRSALARDDYEHAYGAVPYARVSGVRYSCLVRHPVERAASYYRWLRAKEDDPLRPGWLDASRNNFRDWVAAGWNRIENAQCRQLAGHRIKSQAQVTPEMAQEAYAALDAIEDVGITDELSAFVRGLGLWAPGQELPRGNSTQRDGFTIDAATRARLEDVNRYDLELYDRAVRKWLATD